MWRSRGSRQSTKHQSTKHQSTKRQSTKHKKKQAHTRIGFGLVPTRTPPPSSPPAKSTGEDKHGKGGAVDCRWRDVRKIEGHKRRHLARCAAELRNVSPALLPPIHFVGCRRRHGRRVVGGGRGGRRGSGGAALTGEGVSLRARTRARAPSRRKPKLRTSVMAHTSFVI